MTFSSQLSKVRPQKRDTGKVLGSVGLTEVSHMKQGEEKVNAEKQNMIDLQRLGRA